jgi:3-oxoacyl-[acyl-carrier-protein] synthase II
VTSGTGDAGDRAAALVTRAVPDDLLADAALGKRLRRADRFTRMAVLAASDAWAGAGPSLEGVPPERIGLIVASGFGPHGRGFKFLDGLLDFGDSSALPTDFSHSVHGAAAAYITETLGVRGPSLSLTDFVTGVEQAVLLAQAWLDQGVCGRVLLGAVEELGPVLLHCASRMLNYDRRIRPGEGAVFFVLGPAGAAGATATLAVAPAPSSADLLLLDQPVIGLPTAPAAAIRARSTTSFQPHFGHHPSSPAFQLLGAWLAMRSQTDSVDNAATFRPSCDPTAASLVLTKNM